MRIADALGHFAGDQIVERLERQHADRGVDQRGVHIAALSGLLAPRQGREDADRRIDAGENVGHGNPGAHGLAVGGAGQAHDAAHALGHEIVTGARRVGAGLAEAGHRRVDQPRVGWREACIVESEFGEAADFEVLDQHVGARRKFLDDALSFSGVEIEFDRTLAAVGAMKIGRRKIAAVGGRHERRAPGAGVVARALALHLDDVGAKIGENLTRPRSGQNAGKLQYTQTSQRTRHEKSLVQRSKAAENEPRGRPKWRSRPILSTAAPR